jgi:hypothetical protein
VGRLQERIYTDVATVTADIFIAPEMKPMPLRFVSYVGSYCILKLGYSF